jgi:anti-sigma factor RsiW
MSPRIPDTHAEAWALLPWLANGRIAAAEREWVEAHVQTCAECRAELAAQRMLSTHLRDVTDEMPAAASEEQRSFDKLWARIEASESATLPATGTGNGGYRASRTVRWLAAAVIVQAVGLGVLGFSALSNDAASEFVTVTREDPRTGARVQAPAVRLVFAPQASIETINTLLAHQGLEIVAGPGTQGNYTAALSAGAQASGASAESIAAVMSKDPNVSFAEPVAR